MFWRIRLFISQMVMSKELFRRNLDDLYEVDTIDIKDFANMPAGPDKDEFRNELRQTMNWYRKRGLYDWAEQIEVALDTDAGVYDQKETTNG